MTKRVLMTADTVGGVWTYALELVDALAPHGVAVHLATMGRRMTLDQRREAARSAAIDLQESEFALEWMDDPWSDVERAGEWLLELEATVEPDVVHLNGFVHGALPWSAPSVVVGHSCVLSWWSAVKKSPAPASWQDYRNRVAGGLAAAGAIVSPTADMAASLEWWYGCKKPVVIANGRRSACARPQSKEPFVLGAGRVWDEAKNLTLLAEVSGFVPWPVVIAGDVGSFDGGAPGGGVEGCRLLGRIPFSVLAGWLRRAAVFVSPARYEPFGLAALEAGQAGCALVLGDIPSFREVWDDAALYVDPDDADQLAVVLTRLSGEPRLVRALGAAARQRALRYQPESMAQAYIEVYERLPALLGGGR